VARTIVAALRIQAIVLLVALSTVALAQDVGLVEKLAKLTFQKGFKNFAIGTRACTSVGLRDDGKDCRVYQAPYTELGYTHAINVYEERDTRKIYVIVSKRSDLESYIYLVDLDGKLNAAAAYQTQNKGWIKRLPNSPEAQKGFSEELAYWRAKQTELQSEPDRVEQNDGSCPKGQIRQLTGGAVKGTLSATCFPSR